MNNFNNASTWLGLPNSFNSEIAFLKAVLASLINNCVLFSAFNARRACSKAASNFATVAGVYLVKSKASAFWIAPSNWAVPILISLEINLKLSILCKHLKY